MSFDTVKKLLQYSQVCDCFSHLGWERGATAHIGKVPLVEGEKCTASPAVWQSLTIGGRERRTAYLATWYRGLWPSSHRFWLGVGGGGGGGDGRKREKYLSVLTPLYPYACMHGIRERLTQKWPPQNVVFTQSSLKTPFPRRKHLEHVMM